MIGDNFTKFENSNSWPCDKGMCSTLCFICDSRYRPIPK